MLGKNFTFLTLIVVATSILYAESSVYGFGMEEETAQAAQTARAPLTTMAAMRQRIAEQDERIDGLTTIIEGLSASLNELRSNGANNTSNTAQGSDELLQKLAGMIDEINANYVRRDELNKVLSKSIKAPISKKVVESKSQVNSLAGKSNATLYSEGVRHFVKKRYSEAKKRFTITDAKGHKPAASNYYLGEIAYYTKQYEDAIFYFKKSAGLYDKASYIDTLLLHTAISLDKTGEKSQARIFYENIIENYSEKKTAQIAKDRVKKL
jgi:TolA-binding protein